MFGHDLIHSGYSPSTAPNTNLTLWNCTLAEAIYSSPVVAAGLVYLGTYNGGFIALNATTGSLVWNFPTRWPTSLPPPDGAVYCSAAVVDGMVFFCSEYDIGTIRLSQAAREVYALNATDGAYLWNFTAPVLSGSSPAVADGLVFFGSGQAVYALNESTGAYVWDYSTGFYVQSSPAVTGGLVFIGSEDKKVYAINETNGSVIWNYTTGDYVDSSPAVADGEVFVSSDDNLTYALNAADGTAIWNYTTGPEYWPSSPAVAEGLVFVSSGDKEVYALNATDGALIWNYTAASAMSSSPAVADGLLFVGTYFGNFYALNDSTGSLVWSYANGGSEFSSPAVAEGNVYVASEDGRVYAFSSSPNPQSYSVSFAEVGLPSKIEWWVDLNGDNHSSTSDTIGFSEPNGAYTYSTGAFGYSASRPNGSLTVNGSDINVRETFTVVPEFSSLIILPLFIMATLLTVAICKKRVLKPVKRQRA
jgi:outer membrane protein assembly factor BamB